MTSRLVVAAFLAASQAFVLAPRRSCAQRRRAAVDDLDAFRPRKGFIPIGKWLDGLESDVDIGRPDDSDDDKALLSDDDPASVALDAAARLSADQDAATLTKPAVFEAALDTLDAARKSKTGRFAAAARSGWFVG